MCTLHEFDIRSRGVKGLLDAWESRHAEARKVWRIEDMISAIILVIRSASDLHEYVQKHGCALPGSDGSVENGDLAYFVSLLRLLLDASSRAEDRASLHEGVGYAVQGADSLRSGIRDLERILAGYDAMHDAEEREWRELEKQALSSEDFKKLAAYLIATGKASA